MLVCAVGFMLLGLLIDISIILKYDYTPISFTFTLPFIGALVGFFLAFLIVRRDSMLAFRKALMSAGGGFVLLGSAYYFLSHSPSSQILGMVMIVFGVVLFILGVWQKTRKKPEKRK
jgi:peptidoglycan/LPS O-acetylase OafA/YrhL